jgi:hypothetical protein
VTLAKEDSVQEFEEKVKSNCGQHIKQFKVIIGETGDKSLGEIMKRRFHIEVNQKRYEVYPQLETMIERTQTSEKAK